MFKFILYLFPVLTCSYITVSSIHQTDQLFPCKIQEPVKLKHIPFYGNLYQYYSCNNSPLINKDNRIKQFKPEWFTGKNVLDIGCNSGDVTLTIARDFNPKTITGIERDEKLVKMAAQQLQDIVRAYERKPETRNINGSVKKTADFPYNVNFQPGDYMSGLDSDESVLSIRPEYNTIMFLRLSTPIHYWYGDVGIKRCFRKLYQQLRPGGILIFGRNERSQFKRSLKMWKKAQKAPLEFDEKEYKAFLVNKVGFELVETQTSVVPSRRLRYNEIFIMRKPEADAVHNSEL